MLSPVVTAAYYTDNGGNLQVRLVFSQSMDQLSTPPNADWSIKVLGTPQAVSAQTWLNATVLAIDLVAAFPPAAGPTVEYLAFSDYLQSVTGVWVQPFDPVQTVVL